MTLQTHLKTHNNKIMKSEITKHEENYSVYQSKDSFELVQRQASSIAASTLVPPEYRGKEGLGNCILALEMSQRMKMSVLDVIQNLTFIHNRPTWKATFIVSRIIGCNRFKNFDYVEKGEGEKLTVYCKAIRKEDNQEVKGTQVSMAMAREEGWTRNTKYKTMPSLMLRYRAATFFGRQYIPDLLTGIQTAEEIVDIEPLNVTPDNKVSTEEFKEQKGERTPVKLKNGELGVNEKDILTDPSPLKMGKSEEEDDNGF